MDLTVLYPRPRLGRIRAKGSRGQGADVFFVYMHCDDLDEII